MRTCVITSNQDGGTGKFFRQGACKTPANVDARRGCTAGCLQDDKRLSACKTGRFPEVAVL